MGEESIPADSEANEVIGAFVVDGDAGERLILDEGGEVDEEGGLREGEDDGAGCHDVGDFHDVELNEVVDELAFACFEGAGGLADASHGEEFIAVGGGVVIVFLTSDHTGDGLRGEDEGFHRGDEEDE